jgi:hypothetical protein
VPEKAEPARAAQALNWEMQAAAAADGRSIKVSSRTMKAPCPPTTPGTGEPRDNSKMKKVMTSMTTVEVAAVVAAALVFEVVAARATDEVVAATRATDEVLAATRATDEVTLGTVIKVSHLLKGVERLQLSGCRKFRVTSFKDFALMLCKTQCDLNWQFRPEKKI